MLRRKPITEQGGLPRRDTPPPHYRYRWLMTANVAVPSNPIIGICCARAMTGHVIAELPQSFMNSRRFILVPGFRKVSYRLKQEY
jgi:hypothetical protein